MISTHEYTARIDGSSVAEVNVKGGYIRLDAGRSPHVSGEITIPRPADEDGDWAETRRNLARNPIPDEASTWQAEYRDRYSWVRSFVGWSLDGPSGHAYVRWTCPSEQTGVGRGFDVYGNSEWGTPATDTQANALPVTIGQPVAFRVYVRASIDLTVQVEGRIHDGAGTWITAAPGDLLMSAVDLDAAVWHELTFTYTATAAGFLVFGVHGTGGTMPAGGTIDACHMLIEYADEIRPYFFGGGGSTPVTRYSFAGTTNASQSIEEKRGLLFALDPRQSPPPRLSITADAVFPSGTQTRTFNLTVRERDTSIDDGIVRLSVTSDESLLEDYKARADNTGATGYTASIRNVVNYVLGVVLGASLAAGADQAAVGAGADDDALVWLAGQSALDFLTPLVQRCGLRLVCDEARVWTLRSESYIAPGSLDIRYGINLTTARDVISRDSDFWFDQAITVYTWTDSAGAEQRAIDAYPTSGSYTRAVTFEKTDTAYPGPGFSEYAVRRAQGRGHDLTAGRVADWNARAEQPVSVHLDGTLDTQTGLTQSVEFDLDRDKITATTRTIDTPAGAIDLLIGYIDALTGYISTL